jgi:thiol:disulfide interchange protein DsbD
MYSRILTPIFLLIFSISSMAIAEPAFFSSSNMNTQQDEFKPVEQAYQADVFFTNGEWQLIWQLADNHFLYKHGFTNEWLINGKTQAIELALPAGIKKSDEYFGDVEVFYQQVIIPLTSLTPETSTQFLKATSQGCADAGLCYPPYSVYFELDNTLHKAQSISAEVYQQATKTNTQPAEAVIEQSLIFILLSALLGGLILNLMPCVLPVLSIKVMQLARHPNSTQARYEGLAYLAGVVLSFVLIAGIMLALRASGTAIGWGFQLQNPWFIAALVYLFFTLGLSMSGVVHLGHRWMGMGQSLTNKSGLSGAFFTGVLAVVVASPCTAPFMSAAIGYAITQSSVIALLVFATLGLGMALPLTVVSFIPNAGKLLPKPGLWMEHLKQFLAFPLYATTIWLLWVYGNQTSTLGMALLLLGCLAISIFFWCIHRGRYIAQAFGIALLIAAFLLPFNIDSSSNKTVKNTNHVVFSQAALATLRAQGTPVFIDLTADWCITCIANEKSTLETAAIQQAFKDAGIVYMVGDWTDYNAEISTLLNEYGRSGIPLYLLFPAKANAAAWVLPQILTPSIIMQYIEKIDSKH